MNNSILKRNKDYLEMRGAIMKCLTKVQIQKMNDWLVKNARPFDLAKWNFLFNGGDKEIILNELLKYQNTDGGFGNGLEADILVPLSAAIPSGEAIFMAYDFGLDCKDEWFSKLLGYFEATIQDTPSFWECAPQAFEEYPHAPWWNYKPDTKFSPNPCGVIASAMILYGNKKQKEIGYTVANRCFEFLLSDEFCGDHDSYNIMKLIEILQRLNSSLITDGIITAMKIRIAENVCYDDSKWMEYYAQPLDFADSPTSQWCPCIREGIENNFAYWTDNIPQDGVWTPNFSWGIDSDVSRQVTENWKGYITVRRARIFKRYNRIE